MYWQTEWFYKRFLFIELLALALEVLANGVEALPATGHAMEYLVRSNADEEAGT